MPTAQSLIDSLNGLRDSMVSDFLWAMKEQRAQMSIGIGVMIFHDVCSVFMTVDPIENMLTVYELRILEENDERVVAEVKFRPGGTLTVNCGAISFTGEASRAA